MSKAIAAAPVCSRTSTTQTVVPPAASTIHIAVDPVCRYAAGVQTTVPDPSN